MIHSLGGPTKGGREGQHNSQPPQGMKRGAGSSSHHVAEHCEGGRGEAIVHIDHHVHRRCRDDQRCEIEIPAEERGRGQCKDDQRCEIEFLQESVAAGKGKMINDARLNSCREVWPRKINEHLCFLFFFSTPVRESRAGGYGDDVWRRASDSAEVFINLFRENFRLLRSRGYKGGWG